MYQSYSDQFRSDKENLSQKNEINKYKYSKQKYNNLILPKRFCKYHKGSQQQSNQILMVCINQQSNCKCKQKRFCCLQCIDQSHRKHPLMSFKKFNSLLQQNLYHNILLKDKNKIGSIISKSHQKFTEKFAQIKTSFNKILYQIQDQIQKLFRNIYNTFTTTDFSTLFDQIYYGENNEFNSKAVTQYLQKIQSINDFKFYDAYSAQKMFDSTFLVIENKFQDSKNILVNQMNKLKESLAKINITCPSSEQFRSKLNFSSINKAPSIQISDSKISINKIPGSNAGGYAIALLDKPLDPVNNKISFRINQQGELKQIMLGVCIDQLVKNYNFQNIQGLNRGSYAIDQRSFNGPSAYSWNNHDSTYNNTSTVGFNFEVGQIITIQVNFTNSQIIFRKGQSQFIMPIKLTLGRLYPFASPCTAQDHIQVVFN